MRSTRATDGGSGDSAGSVMARDKAPGPLCVKRTARRSINSRTRGAKTNADENSDRAVEGWTQGGTGSFKGQTGLGGSYSFGSRFQDGSGSNPEELLAAAEAACFSMALSAGLEKAGFAPTSVETSAACTVEKVGEGFKITTMNLTVKAVVPGIDNAKFQAIAAATKEGCPVSARTQGQRPDRPRREARR